MQEYEFRSVQQHIVRDADGHLRRVIEGVALKNGQGVKAVEIQENSDVHRGVRPLSNTEIQNIQGRKFMPNLFKDCHNDCKTAKKPRKASKLKKTKKKKSGAKK